MTQMRSHPDRRPAASVAGAPVPTLAIPWSLIAGASLASGTIVALVVAPGVRATSGASPGTAVLIGVVRGVMVAIPLAVALFACRQPAHARFGRLLVAFSGIWFLAALSLSSSPLVYSVGRVAGWLLEVFFIYMILAFPSGRLTTPVDRALMAIAIGIVATLYLPTALLLEHYPTPSAFSLCAAHCPHNVFMVGDHEPAVIGNVIRPLGDVLATIAFAAVAIRLAARIRVANTLVRRTLAPVLVVAIGWLLWTGVWICLRDFAPDSELIRIATWAMAVLVPAIAIGFLVGIVRWHLFVSAAVRRVNGSLRGVPKPAEARDMLAEAFDDPELEIGYWLPRRRRWATVGDRPLRAPSPGSGRRLTEVHQGDRQLVAIVHDATLSDERSFIDAAASLAAIAFDSERLETRAAGMLHELQGTRARLLAAADAERRRIERDLHDGAQQRLVALSIELGLAAEQAEPDEQTAAMLRGFATEVECALEEVRALAHGIYPAILYDRGLAEALQAAARRSPIPATVDTAALTAQPPEIATVVYFCCLEALQNAAKHAVDATAIDVVVRQSDSTLFFSVSDDGCGFAVDARPAGMGMLNMRDRLASVGGELVVRSRLGDGTRVSGRIPWAHEPLAPPRERDPEPQALAGSGPRLP